MPLLLFSSMLFQRLNAGVDVALNVNADTGVVSNSDAGIDVTLNADAGVALNVDAISFVLNGCAVDVVVVAAIALNVAEDLLNVFHTKK